METNSFVQIGSSAKHGRVMLRTPDELSPGGFLMIFMTPNEARVLADTLEQVSDGQRVTFSNGRRWSEQALPEAARKQIVSDLRQCAAEAEGEDERTP